MATVSARASGPVDTYYHSFEYAHRALAIICLGAFLPYRDAKQDGVTFCLL